MPAPSPVIFTVEAINNREAFPHTFAHTRARLTKRRGQAIPDEGPSESDLEEFGGVTRPCPECKAELYDDAEICWKCGHALSRRAKGPPMWAVVTAVVLLLTILIWWVVR